MKVSSSILTAMLVTATLAASSGCKLLNVGKEKPNTEQQQPIDNCPACGMG